MERREQLLVIAGVQTDGRLVEHVEYAAEIRSELRRQPDALRFTATQRRHAAPELEIAEPDFVEELQPLDNLRQNVAGDERFAAFEPQFAEKVMGRRDSE
jgi:hypothetical protein